MLKLVSAMNPNDKVRGPRRGLILPTASGRMQQNRIAFDHFLSSIFDVHMYKYLKALHLNTKPAPRFAPPYP